MNRGAHPVRPLQRSALRSAVGRGFEPLEPRALLSGDSAPWGAGAHLTISFAPDGTEVAGQQSSLEQHLAALGSASQWRQTVLQAFQAWADTANVDFGLVADGGEPFGVDGLAQRDPRFGDVRIGSIALASDVLAIAVPQNEAVAGTWGGEVLFNANAPIASLSDLFSITLHEAGHVLGLEHSNDPNSPMYFHGVSAAVAPTAADLAHVQALYGARQPDAYEPVGGVEPQQFVAPMTDVAHPLKTPEPLGGVEGAVPSLLFGDLTTAGDVDWYRFQPAEDYQGPTTIRLRTSGVSQLHARLRVYDEQGALLADSAAQGPATLDPQIQLPSVDRHQEYFVQITAIDGQPLRIGGYALSVAFDQRVSIDAAALDALMNGDLAFLSEDDLERLLAQGPGALLSPDLGSNDQPGDEDLLDPMPGFGQISRFQTVGSLDTATDRDLYRIELPDSNAGARSLRVRLEAVDGAALGATVQIQDGAGQPLSATVLLHDSRELLLELPLTAAAEDLVLAVTRAPTDGALSGSYRLLAMTGLPVEQRATVLSGQLDAQHVRQTTGFEVHRSQLMQFVLHAGSAAAGNGPVRTELFDAQGRLLLAFDTNSGESWSPPSILLLPGHYEIRVSAPTGLAAPQVFSLDVWAASGPVGPLPQDPTGAPTDACPDYPGVVCFFTGEIWIYQLLSADFDLDGDVDLGDFAILKDNFGTGIGFQEGDANYNGSVELGDFAILKQLFGQNTLPQ
ncbi:MAG: matrixin family metalloprotease [Pirellulales bacterium]